MNGRSLFPVVDVAEPESWFRQGLSVQKRFDERTWIGIAPGLEPVDLMSLTFEFPEENILPLRELADAGEQCVAHFRERAFPFEVA